MQSSKILSSKNWHRLTLQFHPQAKGNTQSEHDHGEMIAKMAKRCESVTRSFVRDPAADHRAHALCQKKVVFL